MVAGSMGGIDRILLEDRRMRVLGTLTLDQELNKGFVKGAPARGVTVEGFSFSAGAHWILNCLMEVVSALTIKDFLSSFLRWFAMSRMDLWTTFRMGKKEPFLRTGAL